MTDGPNGARGKDFRSRTRSACFPCGTALAATWNDELIYEVGIALADEARSKGAHVLLGPIERPSEGAVMSSYTP